MEAAISLHLFGPVQILWNGTQVQGFESRKALALVCYLAEQQQPISRSHLVHLFWGDKSEARGRANLSRVLHNNSALLPGCFEATREYIQFVQSPIHQVDVSTFTELVVQKDLSALLEAVNLYGGDLMADLTLPDCPDFEAWLVAEQEMWRQQMAGVLRTIVAHYMSCGNYEDGLQFAEHLLKLDPWQEETYRQMMVMLALNGQRVSALAQYESCRRILANELGITPSTETTGLYERIRGGDMLHRTAPSPTINGLSAYQKLNDRGELIGANYQKLNDRGELIGANGLMTEHVRYKTATLAFTPVRARTRQEKEQDITQIIERVTNPSCRLLTLVGSDKQELKELVMELMARETNTFRHGVCFVTAVNGSVSSLINSLLLKFNITLNSMEEQLYEIYKCVRNKEMLIIIHNVHPQGDRITLLEDILKRAPTLKILTTASETLNLSFEWIFDIG